MVIVIVAAIILFVAIYNGTIDTSAFIKDNDIYLKLLKEKDYDFLLTVKFGEDVDANKLFYVRLRNALIAFAATVFVLMSRMSFINFIIALAVGFLVFKLPYMSVQSYYKRRLAQIDELLPYYLKGLEVLAQHYIIPVALQKSIADAPEIFKPGLKKLVGRIEAGDSSIDPYVEFALDYPVRDSMRMMRLLYRLGLGDQEKKQNQLIVFSRTISTLQAKSRETKYKERLDKMEKKTMVMLSTTGIGVMLILLLSLLKSFAL